jgi:WD40 repeat protein
VAQLRSHTAQINAIEPLYNGHVASGSDDNTVKIWSIKTHLNVNTLGPASSPVKFLTQLSTGILAAGFGNNCIKFFNFTTSQVVNQLQLSNTIQAMTEVDGQLFVSDSQHNLHKISESSYDLTMTVTGFPGSITAMKASMDGTHFAVGMSNKKFGYYLSTVTTASVSTPPELSSNNNNHIILSMDRYLNIFITGDDDSNGDGKSVWAWDVNPVTNALNPGSGVSRAYIYYNITTIACLNLTTGINKKIV